MLRQFSDILLLCLLSIARPRSEEDILKIWRVRWKGRHLFFLLFDFKQRNHKEHPSIILKWLANCRVWLYRYVNVRCTFKQNGTTRVRIRTPQFGESIRIRPGRYDKTPFLPLVYLVLEKSNKLSEYWVEIERRRRASFELISQNHVLTFFPPHAQLCYTILIVC